MKSWLIVALAAFAASACEPNYGTFKDTAAAPPAEPSPAEPAPAAPVDALTANGWTTLKIGMTKDEVTAAMGADANPNAVGGPDEEACNEYRPERAPEGLLVMLEKGKLTRISAVRASTLKTDKGFGIGDTAEAVKAGYGADAKVTPHKYQDKPAEYISAWSGGPRSDAYVQDDAARGVVYEIGGEGKVSAVRVGGPSIQYVEGCA